MRSLGFTVRVALEKARVYEHAASNAEIILPALPLTEHVRPWHMVTVRRTLEGFGFTDPFALDNQPQQAS